ncbi:formyltransferase family protein [Halovenus rubra]|uniref:Formyltransferase family protein n=2 Tax=Halovenus rubra TaxID=869890 RepID=A0ABD5X912_9EURY|nr:formyltransferase family protein [Halovenus rubra]
MSISIVIVTQDDPFYMPSFFQEFFDRIENSVSIQMVSILDVLDDDFVSFVRRMYRLYGPVNFCRRGLHYCYRTVIDSVGYKNYSVGSVAGQYNIPVESRDNVNTTEYVDTIAANDVDVILSVSAPQIFNEELLDAPNWGCINVHTADLPKYRGMLPTFWALYHGDDKIGSTVHTMEAEVDRGQIVRKSYFPVDESTTLDEAIVRGKKEGGRTAAEAVNAISSGDVSLREMNGEESYFSFPSIEQRREFQRRGNNLL